MVLAVSSYDDVALLANSRDALSLVWTMDEHEFLAADLVALIAAELQDEASRSLPFVGDYMVHDPYGAKMVGPAVARFFALDAVDVICGAGVNSLLHALAQLAASGKVGVIGEIYPDFPHWVARLGGVCTSYAGADETARVIAIERPALVGDDVSLPQIESVCQTSSPETLVIVDESYANYAPPEYSAVPLTRRVPNLAVLRGISKGYQQGGMRFGYCVTSAAATKRVRASVAPMLASSLSLRIGRAILALGDVTAPLRARVAEAKEETVALLRGIGCASATPAAAHVPYVFLREDDVPRLEEHRIAGKYQPFWANGRITRRYRLSVPLRPERMQQLRSRI